jgi:RHS repeat-associated protein
LYVKDSKIEQGETGTPILQSSQDYFAVTVGGVAIFPTADSTQYRNADGTGAETASFNYTYFSGTVQQQSMTTSLPVISSAQNGSGSANVSTQVNDADGRVIFSRDAAGFITYNAYDPTTGAMVKTIQDLDTTNTSDYDASSLPAGWATPAGGGLNLVTTYVVDALGRTVKETSPAGRVTYTTYDDANHEIRVYPGWHQDPASGLWTTTGPVQVNRDDLANNYSETLTYAHTPVSGVTAPTGGDAIANLQGLSRTLMDSAGRTIETDAYFNLSGISYSTTPYLGSVNVNYYATLYGFDVEGNQNRVQSPTGTITRTVYDGQNRAVSTWVGTNDTPASGAWSPTNNTGSSNMSLVSSRVYDNGGVGDGNVTSTTVYPGGPAAPRTTQSLFDWRDRQISSKSGETSALPSGWTDGDIGSPAKAGSASFDGAVWTVTGGGADVYGTADQLNLASQSLSGNGVVIAQVLSQTNTSAFAKAGVMVRGSSAADAAEASVFLTPSGVEFDYRATAGGSTSHTTNIAVGSTVWVKLARIGNTFLAYYSSDGKTWKPVGTAQTVTMTGSVLVGLAVSARNNSAASTATFQNVSVLASPALPAGWSDADINAPALAGSALFDGASFIVSGGGADIYGAADQFNFASQSLTGNTTLIARLGGQTNTSSFAKAGLMVRSSSAANAAEATVLNTPSGVAFQWRATAGGTTSQTTGSVVTNPWLKLVRSGNSFTAYYSTNGTTWTQIGSTQAVTMTGAVLAGLAVSAHNNSAISTAEFDNVSVNGTAVGGAPTLITDGTHRPITVQTLDNLGEATATRAYDGDTVLMTDSNADGVPDSLDATKLIAYDTAAFDEQGRTYQQSTYSVTPGTGAIGNATTTNVFADSRGNTIATYASGQGASKATFDGAGRETETFTTDGGAVNNSGAPLLDYADASGVTNDVVVSQTKNVLDADSNPIETISSDRLPGDSVSATGALGDASGTGGPAARVSYAANFFDAANRPSASENVGTNGGSAWTRPSSPDSSDATHLVSSMTYNSQGLEATSTDPRGIVNATFYNLLGETTETIAAYTGGTPTSSTDQTTTFTYNGNGNETSQTAVMPSGTPNQTTAWVYGVTTSTGSTINSNDLLAKVEYPSATTGAASTSASDDVSYTFDARGETTSMTDQNSTTHSFGFDSLGRPISDAVTILGSGVDGTVQLHTTSYNSRGNVYQMTAYASPTGGAVINQTQDIYNGLGQLTGEYQSNSGAVITASTPETQYTYSDPTAGSLMTSLVYPNGRVLNYGYSNNALDSAIGRVDYLADAGGSASGHLVDYLYLGAGTIVQQSDANGVALSYLQQVGDTSAITDAGDSVTGLNRFGQVSDQNYVNTSTGVSTDRFQYGFDQNSNVLYSNNLVNSSESQLYHANSATSGDNSTAYDPLNRLTGFARGTLVASGNNGSTLDTVNSPGTTQSWSLDAVGNQSSVTTNGTTTTNTTNAKNEMTANGSAGLTFDNNGNTTTDQAGNTYTFDAWNHIATAKNSGGTTIATYTYAANGDRITKAASGTTTGFYYNGPQIIEQRQGSTVTSQNVFNIDYVNDLLLTDNNSTSGDLGLTGSGLGQRLFAQHDANFNVTALADATGTVVERYMYDPYGNVTVLQPDGTTRGGGTLASSHFGVPNLFQGMRVDSVTGLYQTPNRDYSPVLGRWMEADRGFVDGPSLYQFVRSNPVRRADPTGWASFKIGTTPPANPYNAEMAAYKAQYNSWSVYGALVWIVQEKALIAANVAGGSLAGYPHAADGLAHFLENTGTPFDIDLPSFITEDPNAKKHRDSDIDAAMSFIEAHVITSKDIVQADNTTLNSTTPDWNSTLGQTSWYASATGITRDVSVSPNRFSMTFNISLRDYYKWVLGSLKTGGWKLVDGDLAKLNAYGVAQDYPQYGTYQVYVEWCAGQRVATGAKLREPFHIF